MNQQKFEQLHRGLTEQARKVYCAIPISEPWSPTQIMQELHRLNLSIRDAKLVLGCINSLIVCGLVFEHPDRMFRRSVIQPNSESKDVVVFEKQKEIKVNQTVPVQKTVSPIDLLGAFAARLRDLANDAENIALAVAGKSEKDEAETAKLRQLQALLKSLG